VTGFPGPGLLRRLRPTPPVQRPVRLSRQPRWTRAAGTRCEVVPVFPAVRLPKEEPGSAPAASPRVRRRPSPWPPRPAS